MKNEIDARLWHPWLRINRVLRVMVHTRWSAEAAFLRFKVWYRLLRRAEVRALRIHDLRHTYASSLLLAEKPMLYVKERLGHSTVQVTMDFYGQIRPGLNRGAVNGRADATRPGLQPWN